MKTVYIKGRSKSQYRKGLRKILDKCSLEEGHDFIEGLGGSNEFALVWIREDMNVRELKLAIGAKFIWKHRLTFFCSIDEMNPKVVESEKYVMTENDLKMINSYKELILNED
jgi:hypothetical protein